MRVLKRFPLNRRTLSGAAVVALVVIGLIDRGLDWGGSGTRDAVGRAEVVDGDSLKIGRTRVRMVGIDAPEGPQTCERRGQTWPCGREATRHLRRLIGGRSVYCASEKVDQHGRQLATCRLDGLNLNARMVEDGFAVAFGARYRGLEGRAKARRVGLWSGTFQRPQSWRKQNRR